MSVNRTIRRSQIIAPFGVGAIYDIGNESLVSCDISTWGKSGDEIHLERLEKKLKVKAFRMAPVSENFWQKKGQKLEFHRFPRWLFCSSCRQMYLWSFEKEKKGFVPECEKNKCKKKKTVLVPMRFVLACKKGHLQDLPWDKWVHAKQNIALNGRCKKTDSLEFRTRKNAGSGLDALEIYCRACNGRRTLKDIPYKDSMKSIGSFCWGKQPWQYESGERCEETPQVLQRGASNVYYPKTTSALDIPLKGRDKSKEDLIESIRMNSHFQWLADFVNTHEGDLENNSTIRAMAKEIADEFQCEIGLVLELLSSGADENYEDNENTEEEYSEQEIRVEEWPLLYDPPKDQSRSDQFIGEIVKDYGKDEYGISKYIDRVVLFHKLREVRAFRGFHRLEPGKDKDMIRPDLKQGINWLPGIEVFGEGIFIALKESSLRDWVKSDNHSIAIGKRIDPMKKRWKDSSLQFLPEPHARFVMLHTFAHLLIRQLSFECGYSASSLKERIYSTDPSDSSSTSMSGILIYTADSDSEGSLGGLVRQGSPDRLFPLICYALMKSAWCSSDPICSELGGQGLKGLNQAACHGCALVSETSCSYSNVLLDRALVTGRSNILGRTGFFSDLVDSIEAKL